jgi:hypothetical protein
MSSVLRIVRRFITRSTNVLSILVDGNGRVLRLGDVGSVLRPLRISSSSVSLRWIERTGGSASVAKSDIVRERSIVDTS